MSSTPEAEVRRCVALKNSIDGFDRCVDDVAEKSEENTSGKERMLLDGSRDGYRLARFFTQNNAIIK